VGEPSVEADVDIDPAVPGAESTVTSYETCEPGGRIELWATSERGHSWSSALKSGELTGRIVDWLLAP
jgi:poly(3-hydroxybutyrate) depolymerase